jgi:hypothetical protein
MSGRVVGRVVAGDAGAVVSAVGAVGAFARAVEVVIVLLAVVRALRLGFGHSVLDAYVTVTYEAVS